MRSFFRFLGPGFLVAVGYMDPGNWATDLSAGSAFEYRLLWVILLSNVFAIFLQHASIRLGIVTGLDLAEASRVFFPRWLNTILWILAEIGIVAMDLAEVLGSAIALKLLFGIPLQWGVLITAVDILAILFFFDRSFHLLELLVLGLILVIFSSFVIQIFVSAPDWIAVAKGCIPSSDIMSNPDMRWIAIGILGATVMPHNLYLHSNLVKRYSSDPDKSKMIKYSSIDSSASLMIALLVNSGILILSAATFYQSGYYRVTEIEDAYMLLNPILGVGFASTLFAIALLASGQNATITGTIAGQVVMEGFFSWQIKPWIRRLITRGLAIIPAWTILHFFNEGFVMDMLIASQVILSIQLAFAVVPLVYFTSNRVIMGQWVNPHWLRALLWIIALTIIAANVTIMI